ATDTLIIPAGDTEVGTVRTASEESVVFQTTDSVTIPPAKPVAYVVERGGAARSVKVAGGRVRPAGQDRFAFGKPPAVGDALYLGFKQPLAHLIVSLYVECSQARGAGVDPEDPPLWWEVSGPEGEWLDVTVLQDSTGAFNYGSGTIELELPRSSAVMAIAGERCHWLRCRLVDTTRSGAHTAIFSQPPEIYEMTAGAMGAVLPAAHAASEREEILADSDGTPGQTFQLRYHPVLALAPDERLEVLESGADVWEPWQPRESFAESGENDPHFTLDLVGGGVQLGPSIREADGRWT